MYGVVLSVAVCDCVAAGWCCGFWLLGYFQLVADGEFLCTFGVEGDDVVHGHFVHARDGVECLSFADGVYEVVGILCCCLHRSAEQYAKYV